MPEVAEAAEGVREPKANNRDPGGGLNGAVVEGESMT